MSVDLSSRLSEPQTIAFAKAVQVRKTEIHERNWMDFTDYCSHFKTQNEIYDLNNQDIEALIIDLQNGVQVNPTRQQYSPSSKRNVVLLAIAIIAVGYFALPALAASKLYTGGYALVCIAAALFARTYLENNTEKAGQRVEVVAGISGGPWPGDDQAITVDEDQKTTLFKIATFVALSKECIERRNTKSFVRLNHYVPKMGEQAINPHKTTHYAAVTGSCLSIYEGKDRMYKFERAYQQGVDAQEARRA